MYACHFESLTLLLEIARIESVVNAEDSKEEHAGHKDHDHDDHDHDHHHHHHDHKHGNCYVLCFFLPLFLLALPKDATFLGWIMHA